MPINPRTYTMSGTPGPSDAMRGQFSDDGKWRWDGQQWRATLSEDGRWRWDGEKWLPTETSTLPVPSGTLLANETVVEGMETPRISPDARRIAWIAKQGGAAVVVLDGQTLGTYDEIHSGSLAFSPDSRRLSYGMVRSKDQHFVVVDGQESGPHQRSANFIFSADSNHHAFMAKSGGQWRVIRDGVPGPPFDNMYPPDFCFRGDDHPVRIGWRRLVRSRTSSPDSRLCRHRRSVGQSPVPPGALGHLCPGRDRPDPDGDYLDGRQLRRVGRRGTTIQLLGPQVHNGLRPFLCEIDSLNHDWGQAAYLAVQMVGIHGFAQAAVFGLCTWAVGISLICVRTKAIPLALCALGALPAFRLISALLGPLGVLPDGLWFLSIASIPGVMLWCLILGIVLLRKTFTASGDRMPSGV